MDLNKVYFHALVKDELQYEVTIRSEVPVNTVAGLKQQLKALCLDFNPGDLVSDDYLFDEEIQVIDKKLDDLKIKLEEYGSKKDIYSLVRAKALYCHLYYRVERLMIERTEDEVIRSQFRNKLDISYNILLNIVNKKQVNCNDTAAPVANNISELKFECLADRNIDKWNLKFNGSGDPYSFLESVQEKAMAYNINNEKLFASAFLLFSGQALIWFRGVKAQISSWDDLKELLLNDFAVLDYDYRLLGEIRARTQGVNEPIHIYFSIMNCLFSRLKKVLSETEKLDILLHNIRPFYSEKLALVDISSINDLKVKCRKLETTRQNSSLFNEPSKSSDLIAEFSYHGEVEQSVAVLGKNIVTYCPRCKVNTHSLKDCKEQRILKCFKCGELGYTVKTCPKCNNFSKN